MQMVSSNSDFFFERKRGLEGPRTASFQTCRYRSFNLQILTRTPNKATTATAMTMQRRRAKQGSGALHLEIRTGRQNQPPQATGEEPPKRSQAASRAPPPKLSNHRRCGRRRRRGDATRPAREGAAPDEQRNPPVVPQKFSL
jgi:hypothetical protein